MSDTGNGNNCGDNKPQQKDVNLEESPSQAVLQVENKVVTPVKRTPSKRLSAVERAQRESEELVKTLGGSLDIEGGRKTRSSTRGTPSKSSVVHTPPPTKRARGTATPKRGRGRKLETAIEDEVKTSPEKPPAEAEATENTKIEEKTKTDDKPEDNKSETVIAKPSADVVAEEETSTQAAAKDDKPEPMEVDGISKDTATPTETVVEKLADESPVKDSESQSKPPNVTDALEKSEKVNDKNESADGAITTEKAAAEVPLSTDEVKEPVVVEAATAATADVATVETVSDDSESKLPAHENNIEAANDLKTNSNSTSTDEVVLPIQTPATPVPAAGNEHKAENNELCEPKIASPPITANNEGATPQYCN